MSDIIHIVDASVFILIVLAIFVFVLLVAYAYLILFRELQSSVREEKRDET